MSREVDRWQLLDQAISSVLSHPAAERDALLERMLAADPDLLEIARLALPDADFSVNQIVPALLAEMTELIGARKDSALVGRRVGAYQIIDQIGHGGMGAIFRARRADGAYERQVSIKLLPWRLQGQDMEHQVARERQVLAGLNHPGIAQLLDGGSTEDGSPYLVLELVEGVPITRWCDSRRLDFADRLALYRRVLEVVQFAHRKLVVHRDLKPANILVTDDGAIKLLDFGIAGLLEAGERSDNSSRTDQYLTLDYAAPEQIAGQAVSTATDVYGLGCLLYRLLAGTVPLKLAGQPLEEILEQSKQASRPSLRECGRRCCPPGIRLADYSVDMDVIAARSVHPDPDQRYGSIAELGEDLERLVDGLPVLARSGGLGYRAGCFVRRHWLGLATTTLAFVAVGVLALTAVWQADQAKQQRDEALAVVTLLKELMQLADPNQANSRVIGAQSMLRAALQRASGKFSTRPETRIDLLESIAAALANHELNDEAVHAWQMIHAARLEQHGPDHPASVTALRQLALAQRDLYRGIDEPERLLQQVLSARLRLFGETDLSTAESYRDLGMLYLRHASPDHPGRLRATKLIERAHRIHVDRLGHDHLTTSESLFELGLATGDPGLKIKRLRRAIAIREAAVDDQDLQLALHWGDLALVLDAYGVSDEAIELGQRALQRHQALLGELHPTSIILMNNLAGIYRDHDRHEAALATYARVAELVRAVTPEGHRRRAFPQFGIGTTLVALFRHAEAEPHLRQAAAILEDSGDLTRLAITRQRLGDCLAGQGRLVEARAEYDSVVHLYTETLGRDSSDPQLAEAHARINALTPTAPTLTRSPIP
jgi:eukaryotic-like serine/threonine-protein kinase